ncbi:DUF3577 domain-containing protein [Acidovorax citrulli]|nr:DUF3577 domain-containing protein [Paracidovorax citrulli]
MTPSQAPCRALVFRNPDGDTAAPSEPYGPVECVCAPRPFFWNFGATPCKLHNSNPVSFFNLHTSGIGYLNRIRWVETKGRGRKAESFLACSISALRGSSDAADYTYFDLRVSGEEAIGLIDGLQQEVHDRCKVLVSFKIGDIYPHLYERDVRDQQSGRPTGHKEMATLIKGRLILINSISVDGEKVYSRPSDEKLGP